MVYRCRIIESAVFASVIAKLIPTQDRGPKPKGIYAAALCLVAFEIPSENLSVWQSLQDVDLDYQIPQSPLFLLSLANLYGLLKAGLSMRARN
ncbi:hypothetical protein QQP08_008550 [Theobroma cacao]|nr:hypothetical protein QQP08_008550 [Theobroma cacao]